MEKNQLNLMLKNLIWNMAKKIFQNLVNERMEKLEELHELVDFEN